MPLTVTKHIEIPVLLGYLSTMERSTRKTRRVFVAHTGRTVLSDDHG